MRTHSHQSANLAGVHIVNNVHSNFVYIIPLLASYSYKLTEIWNKDNNLSIGPGLHKAEAALLQPMFPQRVPSTISLSRLGTGSRCKCNSGFYLRNWQTDPKHEAKEVNRNRQRSGNQQPAILGQIQKIQKPVSKASSKPEYQNTEHLGGLHLLVGRGAFWEKEFVVDS